MPSFIFVTGPKADLWLVRTVGAVLAASGLGYLAAWWWRERARSLVMIATVQAAALIFVDSIYVVRGTIRSVYLADAVAEFVLLSMWILLLSSAQDSGSRV